LARGRRRARPVVDRQQEVPGRAAAGGLLLVLPRPPGALVGGLLRRRRPGGLVYPAARLRPLLPHDVHLDAALAVPRLPRPRLPVRWQGARKTTFALGQAQVKGGSSWIPKPSPSSPPSSC